MIRRLSPRYPSTPVSAVSAEANRVLFRPRAVPPSEAVAGGQRKVMTRSPEPSPTQSISPVRRTASIGPSKEIGNENRSQEQETNGPRNERKQNFVEKMRNSRNGKGKGKAKEGKGKGKAKEGKGGKKGMKGSKGWGKTKKKGKRW